jgi:hypothetical protein
MLNQVQTAGQLPVVAGVEIPLDDEGRYNLNALHRAHEADMGVLVPHKRPSEWLKNKQAVEFVDAVREQNANSISGTKSTTYEPLKVVNGGSNPGTFAHELIAVEYAGWISPKFRILVNQTFIDYRTGKLVPAQQAPVLPKDPLLAAIYQANMAVCQLAVEMDGVKQRISNLETVSEKTFNTFKDVSILLNAKIESQNQIAICQAQAINAQAGAVRKHEQILSRRDPAKKFNVTHIGSILGMSARETNKLMEAAGLQVGLKGASGKAKGWELLTAGQPYGRQNQVSYTQTGSPHNASVSWSEEVVDVLLPLIK